MKYLIYSTQFIFCGVSMILTSLFALTLSGVSLGEAGNHKMTLLMALLFVLIGCCIDVGKYVFWLRKRDNHYFLCMSLMLMVFSWLASVAFFSSSERQLLENARQQTSAYTSKQYAMASLHQEIASQERLLEKYLASSFHKQWQEGQKTIGRIAELKQQIVELDKSKETLGADQAITEVGTTRFFQSLAELTTVNIELIRILAYGVLALLLEISTLGFISLGRSESTEYEKAASKINGDDQSDPEDWIKALQPTQREAISKMAVDIVRGDIQPSIRSVKYGGYGLSMEYAKRLVQLLSAIGLIEKDKRNSYKLNDRLPLQQTAQ